MRKIVLTLAALAAFGVALPVVSNSASAETVVIKRNNGHHYGWRHHNRDRVVVRERHRSHRNHGVAIRAPGAAVIVR